MRKEIDVYRNIFKKYGDPVSGDWTQESWLNFHISKPYIGSRASDEDLAIYSDFKTIYSLFPVKKKEEDEEQGAYLELITWPEPFSFDKTPDEQKTSYRFDYSEDGICAVIDWLNENLACKGTKQ